MALRIEGLSVQIHGVSILQDIDLTIGDGEPFAVLGESGAGKSLLALSVIRLLPAGAHTEGRILLDGTDLNAVPQKEMRQLRGRSIGMVFEQPWSSLNPAFACGNQIAQVVRLHHAVSRTAACERAQHLLKLTGVPIDRYHAYPHQLSGGMQQRVAIAIALAGDPKLIIADEPGTALDQERQDRISALFQSVVTETNATLLLITHQFRLARALCSRGAVLYAGQIVETGPMETLLDSPRHPYTRMLMDAVSPRGFRPIPGSAPEFASLPDGCRFRPRCPLAEGRCEQPQSLIGDSRCWK